MTHREFINAVKGYEFTLNGDKREFYRRCEVMNAMISQPMADKTPEEITQARNKAIAALEAKGYVVQDTYFTDYNASADMENESLYYLARSLMAMSNCHAVYFCSGWEKARGCRIEHEAAVAYGLDVLHEEAN